MSLSAPNGAVNGGVQLDFANVARLLEEDNTLREQIRDSVRTLEGDVRGIVAELAAAHITPEPDFPALAARARNHLPAIRRGIANLAGLIPSGSFYRYNGSFTITMQQAAYAVAFIGWLEADRLVTVEEIAEALGILSTWSDHFIFGTEDYLHALITLINELARLSPNQVTLAAQRELPLNVPLRISRFTKDLSAGFSLLNLKNDSLRRRFDRCAASPASCISTALDYAQYQGAMLRASSGFAFKSAQYDVKSIEQVLYDVTLRGLIQPDTGSKRPRHESIA